MLIIFKNTIDTVNEETELPDLNIFDVEESVSVPIACLPGWDGDIIQAQTVVSPPLEFLNERTGLEADALTPFFWVKRRSELIVRAVFTVEDANCVIHSLCYDKNMVACAGEQKTLTAFTEIASGEYHAPATSFKTFGARKIKFKIESVSSGTVSISAARI